MFSRFAMAAVIGLLAMQCSAVAQAPGAPEAYRPPAGPYQHLWLEFKGGPSPVQAFIGLRGGKATTAWFLDSAVPGGVKPSGGYRLLIDRNDVTITGDSLRGIIILRQVSIWAPIARLAQVTLTLDAKKSGAEFAGTWSTEVLGGARATGGLGGTLTDEAAIRSAQPFAPGADWPGYHGPHGGNRAVVTKAPLLDDLSQTRPVWRSEQPVLSGWGSGTDGRYAHRAAVGTVNGGSGTPVFANGRVHLFHYVPSGEPDPARLAALLTEAEKTFKEMLPAERFGLTDFVRPLSDTIVTCIDAQTGGTLWRTTFPRLSGNFQTHKWRGINPTACVIGDTVIAADYGHNVVALRAATGDVFWSLPGKQTVQGNDAPRGAIRAGNLAILQGGGLRAVKPETGEIVWKSTAGSCALIWGKAGAERILALGKSVTCLDAASGKQLWTADAELQATHGSAALVEGDILVGHVIDSDKKSGRFKGWRLSDTNATKLWEDEALAIDENLTVSLTPSRAYLVGKDEVRCLDLATGKLLGKQTAFATGHGPGSNQWLAVVGNRLVLAPEGQHGRQGFLWLDADPPLRLLGSWTPPNNHTTAYAYFALGFPVVDGRLFVRGMDGIYCYDLRQKTFPSQR